MREILQIMHLPCIFYPLVYKLLFVHSSLFSFFLELATMYLHYSFNTISNFQVKDDVISVIFFDHLISNNLKEKKRRRKKKKQIRKKKKKQIGKKKQVLRDIL